MRTTALKISQLWKLRGPRAVLARLSSQYLSKIYAIRIDNIYSFKDIQTEAKLFDGYEVELREVPQHESLPWDAEIDPDAEIDADRFRQGARRYAAIWDGRGIDVCWAVSDCDYHDCIDGFTMRLGEKDVYLFDYRGIQNNRPAAFCRFKLWSQLTRTIFDMENSRCGGGVQFYSLVAAGNRVSNAFHLRRLSAKLEGQLRTRVLFGQPSPIIGSDTHPMFVKTCS